MNRLRQPATLNIDPAKRISFTWRGKPVEGVAGDTIATALYAGGVRVFSRSLKYHRPRGLYSLDGECSNCCVRVDDIPNVRAETTCLKEGMTVLPQNVVGSPEWDLMGFMDKLDRAMPAGFYYRSMHKPARIWPIALQQVRKAAGLGEHSPDFRMKGTFDEIHVRADVCVVGGGPAGMNAALAAAGQGLRVVLLEARPRLGGFFDYRPGSSEEETPLYEQAGDLAEQIRNMDNIRVFSHAPVVGVYRDNLLTAFQTGGPDDSFDERYIQIRAESVVIATGCIERPLLFDHNERPGVMQIGCAHRLARTWGLLPGKRAVFSVGHDLGLEAAIDLFDLGLEIACVADIREDDQNPALLSALAERNIPYLRGWVATASRGGKTVTGVTLNTLNGVRDRTEECDVLVASAGMTPVTGPLTLAGAKLAFDPHTGFFLPQTLPKQMHPAGRLLGLNDARSVAASGRLAGLAAAADCGRSVDAAISSAQNLLRDLPGPVRGSKLVQAPVKGRKTFICFDEDTTVKNVDQAIGMGFDMPELIKRFTAAGTGPGQGGIPGHNLPLLVAQHHGDAAAHASPTTVRPPLVPVSLATYAGSAHDMCKRTPVHDAQKTGGGVMQRIGVWKRARRFSDDSSAREEIEAVRNNVGMIDVSTLGKFRIFGPDAIKALQRVYVGDMTKVPEGKLKYSAMCNEDGCLVDDGVITRRGENEYYFTTSTGRAGQTAEWFRYHTRYEDWNYAIVNLTDAFGAINLAGPNARKVLEQVIDDDISNEAFPFMGYREYRIGGTVPVRAMRLGFVGELSYEIHVPASCMQALWDRIAEAGKTFGIRNFGLEAQSVLRMEKGHVIIGSESEQRTTLHDVGLGFLWYRNKPEAKTVGAKALQDTEHQPGRLKLAGIRMTDNNQAPRDGSPVVDSVIRGYVCTARYSIARSEAVGMALIDDELAKTGTSLRIYEDGCEGNLQQAEVVPMPFYDPDGQRMRS